MTTSKKSLTVTVLTALGAKEDDARALRELAPEVWRRLREKPVATVRALVIGAVEDHGDA